MSERKMWEQKEDSMIFKIVRENESRSESERLKWSEIAQLLQSKIPGCRRTGKQCRQRWYNHLNPAIIKDKELNRSEIDKLFELQNKMGNKWAIIAKQFPGRTDNNLKNFFYSSLRRAIRQVNFFLAHYKKKSNIKPFKQSILAKILNINDEKYRQKLDIKSSQAQDLAQRVKQMLATLSLQQEGRELDQADIEFRQKIVRAIQQFNKNCKKRKSKRVEQQQQPDLGGNSPNSDENSQSMEDSRSVRKPQRERKIQIKVKNNQQTKNSLKLQQKSPQNNKNQNLVPRPIKAKKSQNSAKKKQQKGKSKELRGESSWGINPLKSKESIIDELLENENKLKQIDSKKSSSKYDSRSSGNQQQFKVESSDFMRQSNASIGELEPRMLTRRSSSQYKSSFLHNIDNWRKMESKCEDGLFAGDNLHILDPMLESLNIGDNLQKITEGSINQSDLFKLLNRESRNSNQ